MLIAGVKFGVVGLFVGDHSEEDFQQPLSQAAKGAGVAHASLSFLLVVDLSPQAGSPKAFRPEVNGVAQECVAGPTDLGFVDLSGLEADWSGPRVGLENIVASVALRIAADRAQETRRQKVFGPGQAAEDVVIGVALEELANLLAVGLELFFKRAQQFAQAQRQLALGAAHRWRACKLIGLSKEGQTSLRCFRSP